MFNTNVLMKIMLAGLMLCLSSASFARPVDVDVDQLKKLMAAGVVVIDVRTPAEWDKTGIVPASHAIMFFDERRKAQPQLWMQQASQFIAPDQQVAIICRSGTRSYAVGEFLAVRHGYKQVYNVKGGIKAWLKAGNATVKP